VFFIFFPRRLRFFAGFAILLLQIIIFLTGNYNFFNLTTMALCLVLYDDAALSTILPKRLSQWILQYEKPPQTYRITRLVAYCFAYMTIIISIIQFNIRFDWQVPALAAWANNAISPLRMVSTYGPFAVMTVKRHEIIVEGSEDGTIWTAYTFKYKPGNVFQRPSWVTPFQPRLDWQMWFAALSAPENNPWFYRLLQRLLENSPEVLALLESNPFPEQPPRYVRAQYYDYWFTNRPQKAITGAWWQRELVGDYVPVLRLRD